MFARVARWLLLPTFIVAALMLAACSGDERTAAPSRLTVYAAQSLTESFEAIARAFEATRPGLKVELHFGGSSALATQIEEGAPADVFASADAPQMQRLSAARLITGEPTTFARNSLVVVVPAANRVELRRVEDLGRPGVSVVLAQPDVPIGAYSRQVIENVSRRAPGFGTIVEANTRSFEPTVRSALARVELDEADATFVYRTDAVVAGARVGIIEIPAADNVVAEYPIGVVAASTNRALAEAFIAFVQSAEGQRHLAAAGFDPPR